MFSDFTICDLNLYCKLVLLTVQQQMKTIRNDSRIPAAPTIHTSRMKRITPKMFWMQGKYTPRTVPSLDCYKHKNMSSVSYITVTTCMGVCGGEISCFFPTLFSYICNGIDTLYKHRTMTSLDSYTYKNMSSVISDMERRHSGTSPSCRRILPEPAIG